jgi:hypothetical protein
MLQVIILKGDEVAAGTNLAGASTIGNAQLVKHYHTAAATVTLVDSANTQIGNTTVAAGVTYFSKQPSDKIYASAGSFTSVGFA